MFPSPLRRTPAPRTAFAGDSTHHHRKLVPQKDITDELHFLFKKKPSDTVIKEVQKLTFSLLPAIGYTLTTRAAVTLTGNAAFRTDTNVVNTRISTITSSANYTENKQFSVPLETNIWTKGNKYNFVGDIHFMKYPQASFGLGSNSWIGNVDSMAYNYIRFYEIVYRQITPDFFAGAGYIIDWRYHITYDNTRAPVPDRLRTLRPSILPPSRPDSRSTRSMTPAITRSTPIKAPTPTSHIATICDSWAVTAIGNL